MPNVLREDGEEEKARKKIIGVTQVESSDV